MASLHQTSQPLTVPESGHGNIRRDELGEEGLVGIPRLFRRSLAGHFQP